MNKFKIPNNGRGFFVEASCKKIALEKAMNNNNIDTSRIKSAIKIDRSVAPAFNNPYFITLKKIRR